MAKKQKIFIVIGVTLGVLLMAGFTTNIIRTASEDDHKCKAGDDGFCTCSTLVDAEKALENKTDWIEVDYDETTEAVKDGFYRAYIVDAPSGGSNYTYVKFAETIPSDYVVRSAPGLGFVFSSGEANAISNVLESYTITKEDLTGKLTYNINEDFEFFYKIGDGYFDFYFGNATFVYGDGDYHGTFYLTNANFSNVVKLK